MEITFDLDVDLSPIFDWNTHMMFPFLSVEYENEKSTYNHITFWDDRIMRDEPSTHHIQIKSGHSEYFISDIYKSMSGKTMKVYFNWEHMPIVGINYRDRVLVGEFVVPEEYNTEFKRRSKKYRS